MHTVKGNEEDLSLEVELLNQTCLELVAQIERLEKENTQLKKEVAEKIPSQEDHGFSVERRRVVFKNPHFD